MSLWRQLARGVRSLSRRSAADQDVADEVQDYLDRATAAHAARGLGPEDARRAARLELGSPAGVQQEVRESGWEHLFQAAAADIRYAARGLSATPGFTAIMVLTLALGIGGTTAIFSAVNPVLFEPLSYPDSDRLAMLLELRSDGGRSGGTFGMYREFIQRSHTFDAIAVLRPWQPTVTGTEQPEQLEGQRVSASYFRVLGVPPVIGRDFQASDDRLHGPNVVIISDALWRRRFNGEPAVLERAVDLDGDRYSVIGVMPPGFENALAPGAELWAPLQYDMSDARAWGHHLRTVGRLHPGASVVQASQEVEALGTAVVREQHPVTYGPNAVFAVASLRDELTRGIRPALLTVFGAVVLVLVIACGNVTNLLLARAVRRRGEFALRAALGAGRGRLIRQMLTESLFVTVLGGIAGMAVAMSGVRGLVALSPPGLPRVGAIRVDAIAWAFAFCISTFIGIVVGLVSALQAARSDPQRNLQEGSRRSAGGHRSARNGLVVAEVALALILLVGSGLLLRSLVHLFSVDPGFDSSRVLTMRIRTAGHRFDDPAVIHTFYEQVLGAVRQVPGVTSAALTSQLPVSGDRDEYGVAFEATPTRPAETFSSFRYAVSPGYMETMRIPLRRGRSLDEHDRAGTAFVALISESLAHSRFPNADPIGEHLRIGPVGPFTVVGVVGNVKQMSLAMDESDAVYIPASQWRFGDRVMSLVVRARGQAAGLAPVISQAVWSVERDHPIERVATLDDLLAATAADRRFALVLFEAFALSALVLAAAGIYGALAGAVAERTREIGVRAVLGASRGMIVALVLRQGLTVTGLGVGIGLAGSALASRTLKALLFGVSPLDPATYAGVVALLFAVAGLACAVPAWRAARVDPAVTLKAE
jgi:putative ABC transport system permease protein